MGPGGRVERRVGQGGGGGLEGVDGGGEVDRLGPDQDLDRLRQRVQEPGEAGHHGLLLGRGAQLERHGPRPAGDGGAFGAEVNDAALVNISERQAERGGRGPGPGGHAGRDRTDAGGGGY